MLMKGCMMLVIVYWLLMIECVDWIFVMDGGRIVESGSYVVLFVFGGLYVYLYWI